MNLNVLASEQKFIQHKIASAESEAVTAIMFEYLMAGNGLFVRAKRQEFSVCLPLCLKCVKGLPDVDSDIIWHKPKIPSELWSDILNDSRSRCDPAKFKEDIYVIFWNEIISDWRWKRVSRERGWASTIADDTQSEYGKACIELHTHPSGAIRFSSADDRDESGKFRIFAILIDIHEPRPSIRFRCGVYDYFFQIRANLVSDMPKGIIDLNKTDETIRKIKYNES